MDNDSDDPETLAWMDSMQKEPWFQLVRYPGSFNFSAINNHAVKFANGEYLLFLNNDIEVIQDDWLTELASHIFRDDGKGGLEIAIGDIAIYAWQGIPENGNTEYGGVGWIRAVEWMPYQRDPVEHTETDLTR